MNSAEQPSAREDVYVPCQPYPLGGKALSGVFFTVPQSSLCLKLRSSSEVAGSLCALRTLHFAIFLLSVGVSCTFQIISLNLNPSLRVYFWGNPI